MSESVLAEATDDVSLLVLLLEANPFFWSPEENNSNTSETVLTFSQFLSQVSFLVNSFLALHHRNSLAVIATGASTCQFLFCSPSTNDQNGRNDSSLPSQKQRDGQPVSPMEEIAKNIQEFATKEEKAFEQMSTEEQEQCSNISLLSGSLSLALTYITKVMRSPPPQPHPRILCLQGSADASQQYIALMNSIFSAQRSRVPIDTCMVGNTDSPFLQQASHLTSGVYLKPRRPDALLQYMIMVSATDLHSRRFLQLPRPMGVDFRASCFCHKKTIDIGWICSVCLSIFCKQCKVCSTCGAIFGRQAAPATQTS